ncbi:MAG: dihydrolipoamide acetyltransferase family protein [Bacteroidota bacterium]
MAKVEMVMPKMGESVMEGTILTWLKQVGDTIEQDESVLEVATDKVDTEVPATEAGVLVEILAEEGDVIEVGKPIAIISTEGEETVETSAPDTTISTPVAESSNQNGTPETETESIPHGLSNTGNRFYSPLVLNIAREEGIQMSELEEIPGTGKDGRVTKKDMFAHIEKRKNQPAPKSASEPSSVPDKAVQERNAPAPKPTPMAKSSTNGVTKTVERVKPASGSVSGNVEIVAMDRMRKMIAQRMVESVQTAPHVTSFVEADVTNVFNWRNAQKKKFKERTGQNLTFTPIFVEAVAKALRDFPGVNASVDGDNIVYKKDINVGIAVALPSGNLIVPVIHNADQLNLSGIAHRTNELVDKARNNNLKADDLSGGTYTLSNIGSFGNVQGTPIIMQPQVGILATGAIVKKPAVITLEDGQDVIAIRHMMFLSHSYDHRIVDGALGGSFARRVADYLENFDVSQEA